MIRTALVFATQTLIQLFKILKIFNNQNIISIMHTDVVLTDRPFSILFGPVH
jgi:hypothetical protein